MLVSRIKFPFMIVTKESQYSSMRLKKETMMGNFFYLPHRLILTSQSSLLLVNLQLVLTSNSKKKSSEQKVLDFIQLSHKISQ